MGTKARFYSPYAKYVASLKYYSYRSTVKKFLGEFHPYGLVKPNLPDKLTGRFYYDKKDDLTQKELLREADMMRPLIEKDFYQDHTYHNQWLQRELTFEQKQTLKSHFPHFHPGYAITPWVWYPGDVVEVVSGEFQGQRGPILTVLAYKNEIMVQNVNVKTISIPATEDRPAQELQREHAINVGHVRHVDPQSGELTQLRVVTVRDKETGKLTRRRISLATGTIMPIPKETIAIEGDPLKDTVYQDASEETYDEAKEMQTMVQRKLLAIEKGFVARLKESYEFHHTIAADNEKEMRTYQRDVVDRAEEFALAALASDSSSLGWLKMDQMEKEA
jgi:large subunit ribosomal protein L24